MFGWFKKKKKNNSDDLIKIIKAINNINVNVKVTGTINVEGGSEFNIQSTQRNTPNAESSIKKINDGSEKTGNTKPKTEGPLPNFTELPKPEISFGENSKE